MSSSSLARLCRITRYLDEGAQPDIVSLRYVMEGEAIAALELPLVVKDVVEVSQRGGAARLGD